MSRLLLAALLAAAPASGAAPSPSDCADGSRCFDGALTRSGGLDAAFGDAGGVGADARGFRPTGRATLRGADPSGARAVPARYVPNDPPTVTAEEAGGGVVAWLRSVFGPGLSPLERLTSLTVLVRDAWNRLSPRNPFDPSRPGRLTVHHTAIARSEADNSGEALDMVRRIQREHRARGYDDIGYNFLIDPLGRVIEGRGAEVQGSHSGPDQNAGNVGISLMGHFDRESPTQAQSDALERLGGYLAFAYSIDTARDAFLVGHRDVPNAETECPGANGYARLPAWRSAIRRSAADTAARAAREAGSGFLPVIVAPRAGEPSSI
jgi:tetrahydromethanopterin S-methyltransferase subunit B